MTGFVQWFGSAESNVPINLFLQLGWCKGQGRLRNMSCVCMFLSSPSDQKPNAVTNVNGPIIPASSAVIESKQTDQVSFSLACIKCQSNRMIVISDKILQRHRRLETWRASLKVAFVPLRIQRVLSTSPKVASFQGSLSTWYMGYGPPPRTGFPNG